MVCRRPLRSRVLTSCLSCVLYPRDARQCAPAFPVIEEAGNAVTSVLVAASYLPRAALIAAHSSSVVCLPPATMLAKSCDVRVPS